MRFGEEKNLLPLPIIEPRSLVDTRTAHVKRINNSNTVSVQVAMQVALPVGTRRQYAYSLMVNVMGERNRCNVSQY